MFWKVVDAFPPEAPRNNRQNALAVDPAKGKTGKKAVFSPYCGDEAATCHNRAKEKKPPFVVGSQRGAALYGRAALPLDFEVRRIWFSPYPGASPSRGLGPAKFPS